VDQLMDGGSHKNTKRRKKKPAKYSENKDGSEGNCDIVVVYGI